MIAKTMLFLVVFFGLAFGYAPALVLAAEPAAQVATDNSTAGLDRLRDAIKDAYNRGDVDGMARYLHPDVVIVFPDGSVLKGPDALRDYYHRMLKGPGHRVQSYSAEPVIESRTVHNDVGLSYGYMNDQYVLNDGMSFGLNSRFTVTVFKTPDGPKETDGWMIRSFHSSTDAFDNPILTLVTRRIFLIAGGGGLALGALLGLAAGAFFFRRKKRGATQSPGTQS
jgi:ketosteroid isomerase-like protein